MRRLKEAIKEIHPDKDNKQFDRTLTLFLTRLSTYQKNQGIKPSIYDYGVNFKQLRVVDPNFFFFKKHYKHDEFLEELELPAGCELDTS